MSLHKDGKTPLHLACEKGFIELVKCLVNNNANMDALDNVSHCTPRVLYITCISVHCIHVCVYTFTCMYCHMYCNNIQIHLHVCILGCVGTACACMYTLYMYTMLHIHVHCVCMMYNFHFIYCSMITNCQEVVL